MWPLEEQLPWKILFTSHLVNCSHGDWLGASKIGMPLRSVERPIMWTVSPTQLKLTNHLTGATFIWCVLNIVLTAWSSHKMSHNIKAHKILLHNTSTNAWNPKWHFHAHLMIRRSNFWNCSNAVLEAVRIGRWEANISYLSLTQFYLELLDIHLVINFEI